VKKIISILLSALLVAGCFPPFPGNAAGPSSGSEAVYHLKNLGILQGDENGDIYEEAVITRAEFVTIITRVLGVYANIENLENDIFRDVPQNHWASNAIIYCAKTGLVSGYGDYMFQPEAPVTAHQAIKIMVRILGYGYRAAIYGGYPNGYVVTASELNLLKGVNINDEFLLTGDAAQLIYNALDVVMMEQTGVADGQLTFTAEEQNTILTRYLNLDVGEGTVDGIYEGSFTAGIKPDRGQISIDGTIFSLEGDCRSYLGRKVKLFYTNEDGENIHKIISILPNATKNNELRIESRDIVKAEAGKLTYRISDEKDGTVILNSKMEYLYNYQFQLDFEPDKWDSLKNGYVLFIDNNNDRSYEAALIFDYETYIVSDSSAKSIRGKFNDEIINLENEDQNIYLNNSEGNKISFSKLKENHVLLVIQTDWILEMIVSAESVHGILETQGDESLCVNGKEYEYAPGMKPFSARPGAMADVYLDPFGRVAYVKEGIGSGVQTAYLIDMMLPSTEFEEGRLKFYTTSGELEIAKLKDKVRVNGESYSIYDQQKIICSLLQDQTAGRIKPQLIHYEKNDAEEIAAIQTAKDYYSANEDGFLMGYGDTQGKGVNLRYLQYTSSFQGLINVSSATAILQVPPDDEIANAEADDFTILKSSDLTHDTFYSVSAYYNSQYNQTADYLIIYRSPSSIGTLSYDTQICVFQSMGTGISEKSDILPLMEYFDGKEVQKKLVSSVVTAIPDLNEGDVIRIAMDRFGKINGIEPIYLRQQDNWKLVSNPSSTNYADSARWSKGIVAQIKGGIFRLSLSEPIPGDSEILKLESFRTTADNYIVVNESAGRRVIRGGTADDIEIGDLVVLQQRSGNLKTVVIYKK
jgi:cell surface protein